MEQLFLINKVAIRKSVLFRGYNIINILISLVTLDKKYLPIFNWIGWDKKKLLDYKLWFYVL